MCEVTWNTQGTCERSWCQSMSLHALKFLRFRSLSFLLSVSVVVLLTVFFDRCTHTLAQVRVFVHSIVILIIHAHGEWPLRPLLSLHLSYLPALLAALHLPLPRCRGKQARALPLGSWVPLTVRTHPQVMSPTTTSSRRLMSSTPRSPNASNGSLKTSTTTTSSRSLWRRRPVVLSVVVNESW